MDFLPDIEKFKNFFDGTDSKNEISIAVEEAKKYDIFNLISRVSALNLFHQNQTKSVILDTYIEGVLCQTRDQFPSKYTISSGKFRKIINQISDTSLKYSIDPPENMFVQNVMFYGNYRVLNGIDQTPAYNLQHMISVLFAKGIEYPKEFLDATYILVNGMLEISEKIVGGILNTENNHDTDEEKGIMIPSAMELNKYTELVITNGADFRKLFLNRIELLDLVTIEFGVQFEGDFDNKSFYTRPFLYNEEKDQYILLNAGLLPTAIVFWITCLAKKYGIFEEVLENYNDYIFHECQKYLCNLGHKKVLESQMGIDLFSSSGYKEYIASVQNNQLVIVQYLYDDGKNYNACTLHSTIEKKEFNDVVSKRLSYHYSKIIEYGVEKEDIFVIIIINSLGRGMAYGIKKYDYCYPPLRIHPFELNKSSIALKFLIEYIAAVPPKGNIDIGENQYERLMAICSLIIDWSYKNDLFYYQIFNTPIEILKSHRIGMKQQEFQHMFSVNEAIRKEQLIASSVLDNSGDLIEYKSFGEEINAAFEKEYGYSFYQLKLFTEGLREYSKRQSGDTVYVARIMDIIEFMSAYNASFNEEVVGLIIDSIALRQREDFLVPPEPFRKEDVYPWRFNRELSFTRRPIIIRGDEMIWGNRQLDHMIRFTLGLINNGKLKAHSSKMNSLVGRISDERGAEFNDFIYKILVNFNVFEVYPNISKVNGVYIAENNNTLGDIDVLIIDREYHKIIAAEVKNFNFSKNPYEMHLEYKKMFENTKKKKGYYTKHCRRVDWCNKHIDDFKKQYGLDDSDWRVIGVFILSQSLVSTEIYHKEIKMLTEKELSVSSIRNIY